MNSLGIAKRPADTRVVAAMSGGVDSTVTAALLTRAGYDVVGVTLQLYDHGAAIQKKGACCAGQDIHDARTAAERIGIPHYVLDYESRFRDAVIEDFADAYLRGETPIPCVRCNQTVKFRDLLDVARDLGAEAHGHRPLRPPRGGRRTAPSCTAPSIRPATRAISCSPPRREQLDYLRFPLGGLRQARTCARVAAELGLAVADKPDSQDICFVPEGRYTDGDRPLRPHGAEPGDIVHLDGRVLGRHEGVTRYTVGQRRGLNIGGRRRPGRPPLRRPPRPRPPPRRGRPAESLPRPRPRDWSARSIGSAAWRSPPTPAGTKVHVQTPLRPTRCERPRPSRRQTVGAEVILDEPQFGRSPRSGLRLLPGRPGVGGGWIAAAESRLAAA